MNITASPDRAPIAPGTRVYSRSGAVAKYLAYSNNKSHLVYPEIEIFMGDGEVESDWGNVTEWHEVFLKAPREKIEAEIMQVENEIRARKARVLAHDKLALLDTYLSKDGITHYVGTSYRGIDIVAFKDAVIDDRYAYNRDNLKLLTLWGNTKGDLNWCLSEYSSSNFDSHSVVYPCTSLEQARAEAQALFDEQIANWRKVKEERSDDIYYPMHASATKLGLAIPDDFITHLKAKGIKDAAAKVARQVKELADAEAEYAKVISS